MKTLFKFGFLVIVVVVVLAFLGVQPLASYKDNIIGAFSSGGKATAGEKGGGAIEPDKGGVVKKIEEIITPNSEPIDDEPVLEPYIPPEPIPLPVEPTSDNFVREAWVRSDYDTGAIIRDSVGDMDAPYINVEARLYLTSEAMPGYYDIDLVSRKTGESHGRISLDWHIGEEFGYFNWKILGDDRHIMNKGKTASETFEIKIGYRSFNIDVPMLDEKDAMSVEEEALLKHINGIRVSKGLNPLVCSTELNTSAYERTLRRIEYDEDLLLSLDYQLSELSYYKPRPIISISDELLKEVVNMWMSSNSDIAKILDGQTNCIGISILSGKGLFVSVLIQ